LGHSGAAESKAGQMRQRSACAVAIAAAAIFGLPGSALADQVADYHPDQQARDFAGGPGGWAGAVSSAGLCVQDLTCPTLTTTWEAADGADGGADGYIRTTIGNLVGAESTSRGIWTSPPFTYHGAGGKVPTDLSFELARRTALSPLLSTSGSSAHYTVEIVDAATGLARTVIDTAPLGASEGWTQTPVIPLKPSSLKLGSAYVMRITTTFDTEAEAFIASTVDFDNVVLHAVDTEAGGGGPGGGGGGGGAVLHGDRLFLKLKCLRIVAHKRCKVRAVAYAAKNGARMTFPIERKVKSPKGKRVTLRVRPRFVKQLSHSKKVLVRSQIHAGDRRAVKFKRYALTQR
jgi:hypothetical protein